MKDLPKKIKERVTLRVAARMAGIELPERDGVRFCSPFRPDRTPSCTIKGDRLMDWSRGESYDAIALYAAARDMTEREAIRDLARDLRLVDEPCAPPAPTTSAWPTFDEGTTADARAMIAARGFTVEGLRLARDRGLLRFATVCGFRSWIVTDSTGKLAQARRVDGLPYPAQGQVSERKSHTLRGSRQAWPLGLMEAAEQPLIMLVEGGPDLIAACCIIATVGRTADIAPVALLGASQEISAEARPFFHRKRVRIYQHKDESGHQACARWTEQITMAGGCADAFRFTNQGVHDLNDFLRTSQPITTLIQ